MRERVEEVEKGWDVRGENWLSLRYKSTNQSRCSELITSGGTHVVYCVCVIWYDSVCVCGARLQHS